MRTANISDTCRAEMLQHIKGIEKRGFFYLATYLSGNGNGSTRQALMFVLTGQFMPVSKCGVHAIETAVKERASL